ncbi:4-hydroxy-3-methylbut-2-enyl diphosphate reductase [bacterium]|nr:4-hydroxy-3-methylbut-2-enyl diphosphate reductase [bacterium]
MPETKKITLAKYAGFCYGVKRAVDTVVKLKKENPDKNVYILGELIHNHQVIEELGNFGIETINKFPQNGNGYCVVRTHGQTPEVFKQIQNAGFEVCDLTCPDVKKVQQKAIELVKEGYFLVIVGKEEHPEVAAIKANALQYGNKVLVSTLISDLEQHEQDLKEAKKVGVVVQTTQMLTTLNPIVEYLTSISKEIRVINTICPSTSKRQEEAAQMAQNNDLMIVVGSKNSANTTHLADICTEFTSTIHIESEKELDKYQEIIAKSQNIGITAGASTPQSIIDKVIDKLED